MHLISAVRMQKQMECYGLVLLLFVFIWVPKSNRDLHIQTLRVPGPSWLQLVNKVAGSQWVNKQIEEGFYISQARNHRGRGFRITMMGKQKELERQRSRKIQPCEVARRVQMRDLLNWVQATKLEYRFREVIIKEYWSRECVGWWKVWVQFNN